jgi:hypothetical protein
MKGVRTRARRSRRAAIPVILGLVAALAAVFAVGATQAGPAVQGKGPKWTQATAFDVSKPLKELAKGVDYHGRLPGSSGLAPGTVDRDLDTSTASATALRGPSSRAAGARQAAAQALLPLLTFEGISNQDNFDLFGFRVNPPDPVGDVGPKHYVEMVNLAFAVYDKQGTVLLGPAPIGALWEGFAVDDCTDPSGDPIVLYDETKNRWLLSQFTTRGFDDPELPFYNCVAVSKTPDPTGEYYRYAFITQPDTVDGGYFFPDYPKYGVWSNSYIMTTRDFGLVDQYGISVYALEKNKMISGQADARAVQFFLDSNDVPLSLIGDGLLPADLDGNRRPQDHDPAPIVGTMDDNALYGAQFDALNVFELSVLWNSKPEASFEFVGSVPVTPFDSMFPCAPTSRDCLPQPGIANPAQYLDILSYRQRPTWRLAYRNFGSYEAMVTSQSVEASPGVAGMRWYEIRRVNGEYSVHQQGTYSPDSVHRWMGSAAMDGRGNIALGYSVVDGTSVYPGIRYTGRLAGDPPGQMTLGEGTIVNGTGVQTTTNSRWGDYTSMNVDPSDNCTFWYVNEYYTAAGQASSPAGWQTRVGAFRLPGCR